MVLSRHGNHSRILGPVILYKHESEHTNQKWQESKISKLTLSGILIPARLHLPTLPTWPHRLENKGSNALGYDGHRLLKLAQVLN